jgi:hypothetical protein
MFLHSKSINNYFSIPFGNPIKHMITRQCKYLLCSVVVTLIFCAGCATNNTPPFHYAPDDQNKAAKDFSVPPGKSVIYVIDNEIGLGPGDVLQLQVDQKDVCKLANKTFFRMVLEPGSHQLGLRYFGQWVNFGQAQAPIRIGKELIVNMEPGRAYFFHGKTTNVQTIGETSVKIEFEQDKWLEVANERNRIRGPFWHLTGEMMGP